MEARSRSVYEWVRQIRGGVLAGAFTVERHMSAAIIRFMLGERIELADVRETFDEGLLAPLTFERRINVALLIAPHVLSGDAVASLKADLSELRSLRNAMAHRPFWFHPEFNSDGQVVNLVPMIMKGKTPLPLTSAFMEQVNARILRLIEQTSRMAASLAAN